MKKRYSMLAGQMVDVPERKAAPAKRGEDPAVVALRAELQQVNAQRDAALESIAELSGRIGTLEKLVEALAKQPPAPLPAPVVTVQAGKPARYELRVVKRDMDNRMERCEISPMSDVPLPRRRGL